MTPLHNIEFITSVAKAADLPPPQGAEVAFAGRSNAGKSSAINAVAQRKRIAFVSKTPGRTQLINFFRVGQDGYLVDLPGYGYAAVPAKLRAGWKQLVGDYLLNRASLCGVVLIMDIRHALGPLDRQLLEWLAPTCVPVHTLLTKADKLTRQQANAVLRDVAAELQRDFKNCTAQLFSSTREIGVAEARDKLCLWLIRRNNKKPPVKGE